MKRKVSLIVTILLALSVVLAACGTSESGNSNGQEGTSTGSNSQSGDTYTVLPVEESELGLIKATDPSKNPATALARKDTVIIGMDAPQGIFNPLYFSTSYDGYVINLVFEALGKIGPDASPIPDLATWEVSEDGKVWTFHIDPNATFSDGQPVTAEDAEFTYYVLLDPTYDGRTNMMNAKIVGSEAYKNGDATTIEGIKVIDEKTLQITVEEPRATTIEILATNAWVLPKHYYGEGYEKGNLQGVKAKNKEPFGSGPYIFVSEIPGQEVRLVANENYWRKDQQPKIKNVIYKATTDETSMQLVGNGETDMDVSISVTKDNIEWLKEYGFLDLHMLLNNGYGYIAINHTLPKFQDKRVRQALAYGLDRESIVYAYSQGYANVIDVPQSKLSWAYPDTANITHYNYDPEKAAQLLDEAGWIMAEDGYRYKDGEKFVIHFSASSPNEVNDALIPIAIENYKDLGIEFIPEQLEFNAVVEKRNKQEHEMAFLAISLNGDPDPYGLFHTNGGSNKDKYSNPELDKLIEQGQMELDKEKRKQIYNEVYQILNEDLPVIYLYQRYNLNVINSRLEGFEITPYFNFTNTLHQVYIVN